jgi:hypothetical protein
MIGRSILVPILTMIASAAMIVPTRKHDGITPTAVDSYKGPKPKNNFLLNMLQLVLQLLSLFTR